MNIEFSPQEINAVRLYQGCEVPEEQDVFYQQNKAYYAFNLLMMEGQDGERIRICAEGQHPNAIYIQRWSETLDVLVTLFRVICNTWGSCLLSKNSSHSMFWDVDVNAIVPPTAHI